MRKVYVLSLLTVGVTAGLFIWLNGEVTSYSITAPDKRQVVAPEAPARADRDEPTTVDAEEAKELLLDTMRQTRERTVEDAGPEPAQSWEGKPKSQLTWQERVKIGATPLGNYASKQHTRWLLVSKALQMSGHPELAVQATQIHEKLIQALQGREPDFDQYELIARQTALLKTLKPLNLQFPLPNFDLSEIDRINADFLRDELASLDSKEVTEE